MHLRLQCPLQQNSAMSNSEQSKTAFRKARLRELVAKHDGPSAFSRIIGKTRSYVSQLMSDDYPGGAAAFERVAELAGLGAGYFDMPIEAPDLPRARDLPLLDLVDAGTEAEPSSKHSVPVGLQVAGQVAYRMVGDSMQAQARGDVNLPGGTVVVVDMHRRAVPGHIVVARLPHSSSGTVRQLIEEGGNYFLRAMNPDYAKPSVEPAHIIGVVTLAIVEL